jgi:hypothetical protein
MFITLYPGRHEEETTPFFSIMRIKANKPVTEDSLRREKSTSMANQRFLCHSSLQIEDRRHGDTSALDLGSARHG